VAGNPFAGTPHEVPEVLWWCLGCNGGVGCWGACETPPPRCPSCHASNFAPTKFVPAEKAVQKPKRKAGGKRAT
jgi:hypothetical protein